MGLSNDRGTPAFGNCSAQVVVGGCEWVRKAGGCLGKELGTKDDGLGEHHLDSLEKLSVGGSTAGPEVDEGAKRGGVLAECMFGIVVGKVVVLDVGRIGEAGIEVCLRGTTFGP